MIGLVYKLECNLTGLYYIGSTINLKNRMKSHRTYLLKYLKCQNDYGLCKSYKVLLNKDFTITILYENDFINEDEMRIKENQYINFTDMLCVNKLKSFLSFDEKNKYKKNYYNINKNRILEFKRQYYNSNKNNILKYQQEKIVCENCDCLVSRNNISKHLKTIKCTSYHKI